ncbi:hypothetical protein AcV5_002906 [Taiwanofungus camphoratus]|nr:hypothetical protein AcV5_002906 [Antrodia cinnamomea]
MCSASGSMAGSPSVLWHVVGAHCHLTPRSSPDAMTTLPIRICGLNAQDCHSDQIYHKNINQETANYIEHPLQPILKTICYVGGRSILPLKFQALAVSGCKWGLHRRSESHHKLQATHGKESMLDAQHVLCTAVSVVCRLRFSASMDGP